MTQYIVTCLMQNDETFEDYYSNRFVIGIFSDRETAKEAIKNIDIYRLIDRIHYDDIISSDKIYEDGSRIIVMGDDEWTHKLSINELELDKSYYPAEESFNTHFK